MSRHLFVAACLFVTLPVEAQTKKPDPKAKPNTIKPEPLALQPGQPISGRALTQRPAVLPGARGWTLETRRHRGPVYAAAFSPDEKQFATAGHDGMIRVWEAGKFVRAMVGHHYYVSGMTWSLDGRYLASAGGGDGTVRVWDPQSGLQLRSFAMAKGSPSYVAWSPDGLTLAAVGGSSGYVWLYDVPSDKHEIVAETGNGIYVMAWSPDSRTLAVGSARQPLQLVNRDARKVTQSLGDAAESAIGLAWSPDGTRLASGTQTVVKLWEVEEGKLLRKIDAAGANLAWSPDGKTLAASYSSGIVTLYDSETGKSLKSLPAGTYAYSLRYLPKEGTLVVLNYTTMTLWKDGSESPVKMFDLGGQSPVFWTPGRPMVAGIGEKTLILWQAGIGRRIATLEGHTAAVTVVAWSRDGKQLASGGADGKIITWDGATGKRLTTTFR